MAAEKINLYRSERATIAIESEFQTSKMADRSEMARNAIESDFRKSRMSATGHFVKNSKMADGRHYVKNFTQQLKLHNGQKCDRT